MAKKWGKIGSPKSAKRKRWLKRVRKNRRRYKGYGSRRALLADRDRDAVYRPAKKYQRGIGDRGDWTSERVRSSRKKLFGIVDVL